MNTCPHCNGPLEWEDFGRDRTRTAIWCPSCNLMWQPRDQPPRPEPPAPPINPADIIYVRELKNWLQRQRDRRDQPQETR